jgi:hypothetical protein
MAEETVYFMRARKAGGWGGAERKTDRKENTLFKGKLPVTYFLMFSTTSH